MRETLGKGALVAGRFSIERLAGEGGMAQVFRATDLQSRLPVAVKLMSGVSEPEAERFAREARMLAELQHPGIVRYIAHGDTPEGMFLAMEWLEGSDLSQLLKQRTLTLTECVLLARRVSEALAVAHRRGIVHRDLKPANLFLPGGEFGQVKLLDFGVARHARSRTLTQAGAVIGTPEYMAPEQVRSEPDLGSPADVFSLGCILHECVTGKPLFRGQHLPATFAKILWEEPPPLALLRPTTPPGFSALIMRMLAKDPAQRPQSAMALAGALEVLPDIPPDQDGVPARTPRPGPRGRRGEQRLVSVVIACPPADGSGGAPAAGQGPEERKPLRALLEQLGARVEALMDGSLVATVMHGGVASDQAIQAARCALLIHERWPEAMVSLATGRGWMGEHPHTPVGEAVDRAADLLHQLIASAGRPEGVVADELSAGLLEGRFRLRGLGSSFLLEEEHASPDETKLLLGKPTPCVGREHELGLLDHCLRGCLAEQQARAVLVLAPPGTGKSRLRHEFLRRLEKTDGMPPLTCLYGRGDPVTSGSPYGLLAQALHQLCATGQRDPPEVLQGKLRARLGRHLPPRDAERVVGFLGEVCGVRFPEDANPQLRMARQDPKVMSDQVSAAVVDFFRAECAHQPVLLILDDLHWCDALTVKLVDALLRDAADSPLMVLALTRPEVLETFPNLWAGRRGYDISLRGLGLKASQQLVQEALGPGASPDTVARIVRQAGGNALFLEELVRSAAEGRGAVPPQTVLAMLQARASQLDSTTRSMLRAASVYGETFWRGGIAALHEDGPAGGLEASLQRAIEQELIQRSRSSRFPEEPQYTFRHVLMRDAVYSLLLDEDRQHGHLLAARYLERMGEPDPMVLAEHYQLGGDPAAALPFCLRAADQALANNDLWTALRRAERGLACEPAGEALGALRGIQCFVYFWNDQWEAAYPHGTEALKRLPAGTYRWCTTMACMITVTSLTGRIEHFRELVAAFAAAEPAPGARIAFLEAASLLVSMFSYLAQRPQAERFLARLEQIGEAAGPDDAAAWGWVYWSRVYFSRLLEPDPWRTLTMGQQGMDAFQRAGSVRNYVFMSNFLGLSQAELGDPAAGEETLRQCLAVAQRLNETLALSRTLMCLAVVLSLHESPEKAEEAAQLARETMSTKGINSVYRSMAHAVLARAHLRRGELADAEREARAAVEVARSLPALRLQAAALLIQALLRQGRGEEARAAAEEGLAEAEALGTLGFADVGLRLAAAEARHQAGDAAAARAALEQALRQIRERAGRIQDPGWRERYLTRAGENLRAQELAARWQVSP